MSEESFGLGIVDGMEKIALSRGVIASAGAKRALQAALQVPGSRGAAVADRKLRRFALRAATHQAAKVGGKIKKYTPPKGLVDSAKDLYEKNKEGAHYVGAGLGALGLGGGAYALAKGGNRNRDSDSDYA